MSKKQKLLGRLLSRPSDFTWDELLKVLGYFGYKEMKKGKTGGSRRKFVNENKKVVTLHKPHPANIVKQYMLDQVIAFLKENEKIDEE